MTVWTEMAAEIKKILDGAGFTAMGEYTSADSLLHSGEAIGFYGLKGYDVVDEVIGQGGKKLKPLFHETPHRYERSYTQPCSSPHSFAPPALR